MTLYTVVTYHTPLWWYMRLYRLWGSAVREFVAERAVRMARVASRGDEVCHYASLICGTNHWMRLSLYLAAAA
jgi:hypothetical protein